MSRPPSPTRQPDFYHASWRTILTSWLLVGTLDLTGASLSFLFHGRRDLGALFRYIARAVLGPAAATIPWAPVLGGVLHYCVALLFTVFFLRAIARLRPPREHPLVAGVAYGVFMWAVMGFVVLPFTRVPGSQWPQTAVQGREALLAVGILIVAIGWPLAFRARRDAPRPAA